MTSFASLKVFISASFQLMKFSIPCNIENVPTIVNVAGYKVAVVALVVKAYLGYALLKTQGPTLFHTSGEVAYLRYT